MHKSLMITGLIASLGYGGSSSAQEAVQEGNPTGLYLGAAAGYERFNDNSGFDFEDGGLLSFQLGYRVSNNVRTEFEVGGVFASDDSDGDDNDLGVLRMNLAAYYDFRSTDKFYAPYVGGGIGVAYVGVDNDSEDISDEFSAFGEAGISFNINPYIAVVPSYRFTWINNEEGLLDKDLTSHAGKIGLRLSF